MGNSLKKLDAKREKEIRLKRARRRAVQFEELESISTDLVTEEERPRVVRRVTFTPVYTDSSTQTDSPPPLADKAVQAGYYETRYSPTLSYPRPSHPRPLAEQVASKSLLECLAVSTPFRSVDPCNRFVYLLDLRASRNNEFPDDNNIFRFDWDTRFKINSNPQISPTAPETNKAKFLYDSFYGETSLKDLIAETGRGNYFCYSDIPREKRPSLFQMCLEKKMKKEPIADSFTFIMNPEESERKYILEFCHLLEKSKQLFNGLRELPQYGHKQWHSYFGRTFDVYTKLWKFQQQHRAILDTKYGLKRWQIGEIASKIGQLYYHFYLRTSEFAYLNEAFSFYYAIRGRSYYTQASKEDKSELMVKKLRYYARFIVVCLLLKKPKLVRELAKELEKQIYEYGKTYDPEDQAEWNVVMEEVKSFLQAEPVVSIVHPDNYSIVLTNRIAPHQMPHIERAPPMTLILQEILVVGSTTHQVKFSEMTMDMYRIIQTFERETPARSSVDLPMQDESPRQRYLGTPSVPTNRGYNVENGPRYENPHKYLLFRPTASQVLVYLASGMNDLAPNGVLLLYLSADQQMVASKHYEDENYDAGGLNASGRDYYRDKDKTVRDRGKEPQCLHPMDLAPFTRRPLFIIVDSDNSYVFQQVPRTFGQPLVVLMSPSEMPASFLDRKHQGSMFTLFLHAPLAAFCYICEIYTLPLVQWDRADTYIDAFMVEAAQIASRHRTIDLSYITFLGDDFLRIILVRFLFCEVTLRMHRAFRSRAMLTHASPPLPEDIYDHPALVHIVLDLASYLQVRNHFQEPGATGPPPPKE